MPERKVWNAEEDRILRFLKEERGEHKWSVIARLMGEEFGVGERTGKQCRQRYHNHLDSSIVSGDWALNEERYLFHLHSLHGNKWSLIAQKLPGRSDNCVKNHFYSKMRKALRRLNKLIQDRLPEYGVIRTAIIYKIIETTESRFKTCSRVDEEVAEFCLSIQSRLFNYQCAEIWQPFTSEETESAKSLIKDITLFERDYKKGFKGFRRPQLEHPNKQMSSDNFHHLKPPPSNLIKTFSSGSEISEQSEEASFISISSCASSLSDLSQPGHSRTSRKVKRSKATRARSSGGSSGKSWDLKEQKILEQEAAKEEREVQIDCGEVGVGREQQKKPQQTFIEYDRVHFSFEGSGMQTEIFGQFVEQERSESSRGSKQDGSCPYKDIFHDDTPMIGRILGPNRQMHMEEQDDQLFMEVQEEPKHFQ